MDKLHTFDNMSSDHRIIAAKIKFNLRNHPPRKYIVTGQPLKFLRSIFSCSQFEQRRRQLCQMTNMKYKFIIAHQEAAE